MAGKANRVMVESLENRVLFAAGALDKSFGGHGVAAYDPGNGSAGARPVATLPDGSVYVAGDRTDGATEIVRFNNKGKRIGALALTFGVDDFNSLGIMQSDSNGKLLVAGTLNSKGHDYIFVTRLNADLSLDKTFGSHGVNTSLGKTPTSTSIHVTQMREAADGSIFVCGYKEGSSGGNVTESGYVVKFTPKGQADTTFAKNGFDDLSIGAITRVVDLDVRANGQLVLGGAYQPNISFGGVSNLALAQLMPDGAMDTSGFGTKGVVHYNPFGNDSSINGVRVLKNGRIVIAGQASAGVQGDQFTVMKFTIGGGFDKTFGHKGRFYFAESDNENAAGDLKIESDGKIVVSGVMARKVKSHYDEDAAVLRLTADGKLDSTFNGGNPVLIDLGSRSDVADYVVIDAAGRIVLGGSSQNADFTNTLDAMRVLTA